MTRGDRSKLVPNISVGPWNRKVRSIWCINRNFRNFRLNGKRSVTPTLRGNEKQVELQGFELSRVDFKIQFAMLKFDPISYYFSVWCSANFTYFIRIGNLIRHFYDKKWSVRFIACSRPYSRAREKNSQRTRSPLIRVIRVRVIGVLL